MDYEGRKCAEKHDITTSCKMKFDEPPGTTNEMQEEIRINMVTVIEKLRNDKFPHLMPKRSIISGFGVGASVASDIAFGNYYDTFTPFGSVILVGFGYTPGSLTVRRFDENSASLYGVSPIKPYNASFNQIAKPYVRFSLIGGNASTTYNDTSVKATFDIYCAKMSIDCANFMQLNCTQWGLMSANESCGYANFTKMLIDELKVVAEVDDGVEEYDPSWNELNEAVTSTWTLTSASIILITG